MLMKKKKEQFNGKLYITIDTEMDADMNWEKHFPPEFSSVLEGIPNILRPIWNKYQICPIYFVSPEVLENDMCCIVLRNEVRQGAIIGAHLHPEYIEPEKLNERYWGKESFPCSAYSREVEKQKIKNLTELIETKIGVRPAWYRAARFGADNDTIKILKELGYKYDSSLTPGIDWSKIGGPNHKCTPLQSYFIQTENIYDNVISEGEGSTSIKEFPVTIIGKKFGIFGRLLPEHWLLYKWLRPTHMLYIEERKLLRTLRKKEVKDIVMMFHSMEIMIGKTPYVRNILMQKYYIWRLDKTIAYAGKVGYHS